MSEVATRCLVDWFGVTLAGSPEPVAQAVALYAGVSELQAPLICCGPDAEPAALVNGAAAHALDFDDTHIPTDSHFSAVLWSALFAMADTEKHSGEDLLRAFTIGYEVAAKLAGRRMGFSLQFRWFHPSAVLGRIAASAAAAALLRLESDEAAHSVALSLTMAGGLRASSGGMGKPLQVGCAARDGGAAAKMAGAGVQGSFALLEPDGGFAKAFVQDGYATIVALDEGELGQDWAVLKTSFKPYACLHGIHPSIDAARMVAEAVDPADITAIRAFVAPGVKQVGRYAEPQTPLEAKFSVAFCTAMALAGHKVTASDFTPETLANPALRRLCTLVDVVPEKGRKMLDSAVEVTLSDGRTARGETALSRGHPGNPMSWEELEAKYFDLAEPVLGTKATLLLTLLHGLEEPEALRQIQQLLAD